MLPCPSSQLGMASTDSHSRPQSQEYAPLDTQIFTLESIDDCLSFNFDFPHLSEEVERDGMATSIEDEIEQLQSSPSGEHSSHFFEYPKIDQCIEKICSFVTKLSDSSTERKKPGDYQLSSIRSEEKHAKHLKTPLQRWQKHLPIELQSEIKLNIWKDYESRFHNAKTFSVLLSKMANGFGLGLAIPGCSWSRGIYNRKKPVFAKERLLPVLLAIQNKPLLAERLFCLAEDGLGGCTDRPMLTFVDIELEVKSDAKMSELCNSLAQNKTGISDICNEFVEIEHQKLRKSMVISDLIKQFNEARKRRGDRFQDVVIAYKAIAKQKSHYFPPIAFTSSASMADEDIMRMIQQQAISNLESIDEMSTKNLLIEHLMTSDNWLKLLITRDPELGKSLQRLEQQRTRYSENLLDLPTDSFQDNYAKDIQSLESAYHRLRTRLLNKPETRDFTAMVVTRYMMSAP